MNPPPTPTLTLTSADSSPAPQPNALIDRARIRGASRMIPQGTEATAVTPEQMQQVAQDVEMFSKSNKVSQKAIAKAIGWGPSTLTEFLKGTYIGKSGQVAIDLDDWLIEEEQRRSKQSEPNFVWTNVASYIRSIAAYCLDHRKLGLIYGPETSGLGKTMAMAAIHQAMGPRRSAMVTFMKGDASPSAMLTKICGALGINQGSGNNVQRDRIVEHLTGRSHILLLDQIHNLRFSKEDRCYYYLADIYDATKTAQLWAGTSDMVGYLERQAKKTLDEPLAQIRRRIFPCLDLVESLTGGEDGNGQPLYTVEQIREIFNKPQLKLTGAAARWLTALACAKGSGALGIASNLVEYSTMLVQMRRLPNIDVPILKESLKCSVTDLRCQKLIAMADAGMQSDRLKVA